MTDRQPPIPRHVEHAGIDPEKLQATLLALDPSERPGLCLLVRNDLESLIEALWRHLRRWDRVALLRTNHQIISLSATVGATDLHRAALGLQRAAEGPSTAGLDRLAREIDAHALAARRALAELAAPH
jgi:hypothetical protein